MRFSARKPQSHYANYAPGLLYNEAQGDLVGDRTLAGQAQGPTRRCAQHDGRSRRQELCQRREAPALNNLVGGPSKVFEASYAQIWEAIRALVKRAMKGGDIRRDPDAIGNAR